MLGELLHETFWDRIGELFGQMRGRVEDGAIVEDEVEVGGLVGFIAASA